MATDGREQILETVVETAPVQTVEERVVDQDGAVRRVVRSVGEPVAVFADPVVVARPAPQPRLVRRFWRRTIVPLEASETRYTTVGGRGGEPSLGQFLRLAWFFVGLLEGLLALRFLLALFGANAENGFAALVYGLSWPFVAPFRTLFGVPAAGGAVLETYTLMAMIVVLFGWWIAVRLIGVMMNRSVDE